MRTINPQCVLVQCLLVPCVLVPCVMALVCLVSISTAHAETGSSSWSKRVTPQAGGRRPTARGPEDAAPRSLTGQTLRPARGTSTPLGSTLFEPSGKDAAYIAFEQGQYLTALKLASERAKNDDPQAHTLLGRLYARGLGVPRDELKAAQYYRRGAQLGDTEAMFAFGVILAAGTSIKKDPEGAAQMFEQAAKRGHPAAHYNLALLFLTGKGKPENPIRAAQHLEYAARKGLAEAQYDLATLYHKGHGVEPNAFKAAQWLRQAAESGMASAQFEYAVALLQGRGLNADKPKIIDYLTAAADAGVGGAQLRLAHIYATGIPGTSRNMEEAAKWHEIARTSGIADKQLDAIIQKFPAKIRRQAAAAASAYRDRAIVGTGAR